MICNLCGSKNNDLIYEYARLERRNVLKCQNCGLIFLEMNKEKEEIELFYKDKYRKLDTLPVKSAEQMYNDPVIQQDCKNRLEWIKEIYGSIKALNT